MVKKKHALSPQTMDMVQTRVTAKDNASKGCISQNFWRKAMAKVPCQAILVQQN
jgi:hypothetical protein